MKRNSAGFTLIEILIAITILVIGVSGIIALFPSTIETASKVVEDTYAATVAQSVVDSLSAAQRDGRVYPAVAGTALRYMTFDHDGCHDAAPTGTMGPTWYNTNYTNDHVLLLPRSILTAVNPTTEPLLLYPYVPSSSPGGASPRSPTDLTAAGNATPTDETPAGGGSATTDLKVTVDGSLVPFVRRVYPLGQDGAGNIRTEFLPKDATGAVIPGALPSDPYPQYSFALAMRRVGTDNSSSTPLQSDQVINTSDLYNDDLYEVRVMVFKNFHGDSATITAIQGSTPLPVPRTNVPVRELVTFIELGPGQATITTGGASGVWINGHAPNQ